MRRMTRARSLTGWRSYWVEEIWGEMRDNDFFGVRGLPVHVCVVKAGEGETSAVGFALDFAGLEAEVFVERDRSVAEVDGDGLLLEGA